MSSFLGMKNWTEAGVVAGAMAAVVFILVPLFFPDGLRVPDQLTKIQAEAVQRGYAEYVVDSKTLKPVWRWKEPTPAKESP